ncbi:nuclear transport factor 2 family protein [bacterium]|nr:nuclear transport factor 2 family protein [bacterium]
MKDPLISVINVLFCAMLLLVGCSRNESLESRERAKAEIAQVIDSAIGWFKTKDFSIMYRAFAQDEAYLEVHPDSTVIKGFSQFEKNLEIFRNPDFLYLRHEIRDLHITLSKKGDTAWFFCMLDDISTWKGREVGWRNTRWTGTLEKRDGRWVIVQQHFSFAST